MQHFRRIPGTRLVFNSEEGGESTKTGDSDFDSDIELLLDDEDRVPGRSRMGGFADANPTHCALWSKNWRWKYYSP